VGRIDGGCAQIQIQIALSTRVVLSAIVLSAIVLSAIVRMHSWCIPMHRRPRDAAVAIGSAAPSVNQGPRSKVAVATSRASKQVSKNVIVVTTVWWPAAATSACLLTHRVLELRVSGER